MEKFSIDMQVRMTETQSNIQGYISALVHPTAIIYEGNIFFRKKKHTNKEVKWMERHAYMIECEPK